MPQIRRNPSSTADALVASPRPMTYQALARKWRPQDFSSLIGQEPVVTALRNALTDGRIAQAYLFAGIRGVGKTTAARVLAKALNCERGPAADPCNECRACSEITSGADLDVLEVDAATYSKVEQIRELTETLRYGPAHNRYKVVVLDEVHRLSRQAFDALLKIVEEPPDHLVFIFATTEIEAVPATILSRCQEFHFRRVPGPVLAAHLETLAAAESITISPSAVKLVARAGDGSVRDAVALLDQLATYGAGTVSDEEAARLLAGFDPALFHQLLRATLEGDAATLQRAVGEIEAEGRDPRQIYSGLLAYGRDALHLATGSPADGLELPTEEAQRLAELVAGSSYEDLLRWTHHLLQSESLLRRSEAPGLALEIALLRAAELPKVQAVEGLFGRTPSSTPPPDPSSRPSADPGEPSPSRHVLTASDRGARDAPDPGTASASEVAAEPPPVVSLPTEAPAPDSAPDSDPVQQLLHRVRRDRQVLAAHLGQAQELRLDGQRLIVVQDPEDGWLGQALDRTGNRDTLELALREVLGEGATFEVHEGEVAPRAETPEREEEELPSEVDSPTVQAVLQIFDGAIEATPPESAGDR